MSIRALALPLALLGCDALPGNQTGAKPSEIASSRFPKADRPVAPIVSSRWSTEEARDRLREADKVMAMAGVTPGMTVADIGAGEGYYTVRLAERVGAKGRVVAQDVVPAVRDALAERVLRERLDNVSVKLGGPADPKLPEKSFDRVFLVHMYHEIAQPLEFLWRLWPALRAGGQVIIVDAERKTQDHGTPIKLLECELNATGYRKVEHRPLPQNAVYFAAFEREAVRPEPEAIKPCTG
jgi:ubiquinone/menaquinone biosynthesis C-methylase UbiE